ncbi:hypothetical protein MAR_025901 [Mya arenaria]|uniref:Uncharacterized protein n=1 Tax=Mya arenaria TaxID=6604 RepID=A0ABY7ESL4_MYAAR|nr:hypothetical protein MAR_025901 [Mya arenaria]
MENCAITFCSIFVYNRKLKISYRNIITRFHGENKKTSFMIRGQYVKCNFSHRLTPTVDIFRYSPFLDNKSFFNHLAPRKWLVSTHIQTKKCERNSPQVMYGEKRNGLAIGIRQ